MSEPEPEDRDEPFTTGSAYLDDLLFDTSWCVPNRLYGALVNAEGDAV